MLPWWEKVPNDVPVFDHGADAFMAWVRTNLIVRAVQAEHHIQRHGWFWSGALDIKALCNALVLRPSLYLVGDTEEVSRKRMYLVDAESGVCLSDENGEVSIEAWTLSPATLERIKQAVQAVGGVASKEAFGRCFVLNRGHSGHLSLMPLPRRSDAPLIPTNYAAAVLEAWGKARSALESPTPLGRLVVVSGPPGCGKTYLVRAWLAAVRARFIYVPAGLIRDLTGPQLISALCNYDYDSDSKPNVLIVEDADTVLLQRGVDNLDALSALLNLSAGILGDALDVRVIATTNAEKLKLDAAVLRPGRLCQHIEVERLSYEDAASAYRGITGISGELEPRAHSLAELYQRAAAR